MSNHPAVEKSFAMLLSEQPNVLPNLLSHLEKGGLKEAGEILLSMLPYCRVMYFEPKWKQHSWGDRGLFFPATVNFWECYQNFVKNVEAFIIDDLTFKLNTIHGPMLAKIVWSLNHEAQLKKNKEWGVVPFQYFVQQFDLYHLKHTALMTKLVKEVPYLYSKHLERQVESTLFSPYRPRRYCVQFSSALPPALQPQGKTLVFCLTSYFNLPSQLLTPKGVIRFLPHNCDHCENTSDYFPGLKHLKHLILHHLSIGSNSVQTWRGASYTT